MYEYEILVWDVTVEQSYRFRHIYAVISALKVDVKDTGQHVGQGQPVDAQAQRDPARDQGGRQLGA
jgi:hypothetical protein